MMRELLDDLRGVGAVDGGRLQMDRMLRHAVERILTQMVELAVSVNGHVAATTLGEAPRDYRSSFTLAERAGLIDADLADRLRRSVGLRNILTHEYADADLKVVARSVESALSDYGAYVRSASAWIAMRSR